MTVAKNTYNTDSFLSAEVPNASGYVYNQGDMLVAYANTSYQASGTALLAQSNFFIGVAGDTSPIPNNYSNQPSLPTLVWRVGRVALIAKNGDTFTPYAPVWPAGIDNQTVTVTSGNAFPIGNVANVKDNSQQSLVGTGSNSVLIDIRPNMPAFNRY